MQVGLQVSSDIFRFPMSLENLWKVHEIELKMVEVSKRSLNIKLNLSESPGYSVICYVDGAVQLLCSSAMLTGGL